MNRYILAIIPFTFFIFSGCKKDSKKTADILTSKTWKIGLTDKNPSTNPQGSIMYNPAPNCTMDDTFKFGPDGKLVLNRNTEKCGQNELQTETQTYTINRATKKLTIDGMEFNLAEESNIQIKYYAAIPSTTGFVNMIFLLQ